MNAKRRTSVPLLVGLCGLALVFGANCGSVMGNGGTGGSGGSGTGGDHATGGTGGHATGGDAGGSAGTGTGGDHASGGTGGSATGGSGGGGTGGDHATGGAGGHATGGSGTGGDHATGGTGGHATGGAGGNSTGGAGGHATGGAGGGGGNATGGQGGGESCTQLTTDYAAAFLAAAACTPGAPDQCQTLMPSSLSCGCSQYVNDATTLKALKQQWTDEQCVGVVCPLFACIAPGTAGNCVATDGAAPGGICGR
ncbi:MAG TPA: hypothetical protein VKZ18_28065 [Polyangia bacterium]|nr:hypothetical protein [Polyangia bacterium]